LYAAKGPAYSWPCEHRAQYIANTARDLGSAVQDTDKRVKLESYMRIRHVNTKCYLHACKEAQEKNRMKVRKSSIIIAIVLFFEFWLELNPVLLTVNNS
jgi:hypothetical protein